MPTLNEDFEKVSLVMAKVQESKKALSRKLASIIQDEMDAFEELHGFPVDSLDIDIIGISEAGGYRSTIVSSVDIKIHIPEV